MTSTETSTLQICAGALQDISEIVKDKSVSDKIKEVQLIIEKLINKKW